MRPTSRAAARPLVICLHSSGATGRQWHALAERLRATTRVVTPDLTGHGEGPVWRDEPGDILAADAAIVLDLARAAAGPVHLVGHSWGGAVALRAARAQPGRFASVAVYEPVLFRLLRDRGERRAPGGIVASMGRALRADLRAGNTVRAARRFVDFWNGGGTFDALPPVRREAIAARMPAVTAHFTALWNDDGRLDSYRALAVPAMVCAGSQTHAATRLIAELLAAALPVASAQRMPGMGHMGPVTHADVVAQSIATFVAAQEQARQSLEAAAPVAVAA